METLRSKKIAAARLVCSMLLQYPDEKLISRIPEIRAVLDESDKSVTESLDSFLLYIESTRLIAVQEHFVAIFDLKRKASPYLSFWTDGDTRNRGIGILKFKQAYLDSGFEIVDYELADHLAVVLEFAAVGDVSTGEALLTEFSGAINLINSSLEKLNSPYKDVLKCVVKTMPDLSPEIRAKMMEMAAAGPPVESVGLEPFGVTINSKLEGLRR